MLALLMAIEDFNTADMITMLYRKYKGLLYKIAYEKTGILQDAEDAVSDAFTALIATPGFDFSDEKKAKKWLAVTTRNFAINISKKNSYRHHEELSDGIEIQDTGESVDDTIDLQNAIAMLPEDLSKLLILFYDKGYTTAEIAKMQNMKQDTVRKKLLKAKRLLEQILTGDMRY